MNRRLKEGASVVVAVTLLLAGVGHLHAGIPGVTGPNFSLTAKAGYVSTPDPNQIYVWGFADGDGPMQYPGPTLVVKQGDQVQVVLTNTLSVPVSIVFPGHKVQASGGSPGILTQEAPPGGGTVAYTFTATHPGTYHYHSGTRPELQIEMGLVGALIVRPVVASQPLLDRAYAHADSAYDHEYLFLQTEIDPRIHELVETGRINEVDNTTWSPAYWSLNGRCAPDTMLPAATPLLPNQPYNCLPVMHPGTKLLLRFVNAGRDFHPFHPHGNHMRTLARDGRLRSSGAPGAGADLAPKEFTITVTPGGTADAIFEWTGQKLGWDMYGHKQDRDNPPVGNFPGPEDVDHNGDGNLDNVALEPNEYEPDHGKPFPVMLPDPKDLTFGTAYSGSPFLGSAGALPPGEGGFNPNAGFFYMWHSHKEKEMLNNNIFPGGMMTMLIILPPGAAMP